MCVHVHVHVCTILFLSAACSEQLPGVLLYVLALCGGSEGSQEREVRATKQNLIIYTYYHSRTTIPGNITSSLPRIVTSAKHE